MNEAQIWMNAFAKARAAGYKGLSEYAEVIYVGDINISVCVKDLPDSAILINKFELLYNTENGFAKSLFGEMEGKQLVDEEKGMMLVHFEFGWKQRLEKMVGQDPTTYIGEYLERLEGKKELK